MLPRVLENTYRTFFRGCLGNPGLKPGFPKKWPFCDWKISLGPHPGSENGRFSGWFGARTWVSSQDFQLLIRGGFGRVFPCFVSFGGRVGDPGCGSWVTV